MISYLKYWLESRQNASYSKIIVGEKYVFFIMTAYISYSLSWNDVCSFELSMKKITNQWTESWVNNQDIEAHLRFGCVDRN